MHRIAILALHGVVPFDLGVPCDIFSRARLTDETAPYDVMVCGATKQIESVGFKISAPHGLSILETAQTIVVPGVADIDRPIPKAVANGLRSAANRGARLASICTGAFVLAASGLLSGLRATTHWLAAEEFGRRYPAIEVDPSVLFVDNGNILTSAGAAAGIDLCLHIVRRDYGAAVAAEAARLSVVPAVREGGQAQFILRPLPSSDDESLAPLLNWLQGNLEKPLLLDAIAAQAGMSRRSLSRRFREQTGTTPANWVSQARFRRAQQLLETTDYSIDRIASLAGFACTSTLRAQFKRVVGKAPNAYRRMFSDGV